MSHLKCSFIIAALVIAPCCAADKKPTNNWQKLFKPQNVLNISRYVRHKEAFALKLEDGTVINVLHETDGVDTIYSAQIATATGCGPHYPAQELFDAAKIAFQTQQQFLSTHGLSMPVAKPKGSLVGLTDITDPAIKRFIKIKYSPVKLPEYARTYTITHTVKESANGKKETFKASNDEDSFSITQDVFEQGSKTAGAKSWSKEKYFASLLLGSIVTRCTAKDGQETFISKEFRLRSMYDFYSEDPATFHVVKAAYLLQERAKLAQQAKPEEGKKE